VVEVKMSGPTLLKEGNLEEVQNPRNASIVYGPSQAELDKLKPIDYIMDTMRRKYSAHDSLMSRVMILLSSTGSGKSTTLPPTAWHLFGETFTSSKGRPRSICCTQPRVLTSVDIPETILRFHTREALDKAGYPSRKPLKMGKNIGTQNSVIVKKPIGAGIIYMTVGVLGQQLNVMSDQDFMDKYSVIFVDEVHERSMGTDSVLYLMKRFLARNYRNKYCPFLVVMSATFDVWKFCDYLLSDIPERYESIIRVRGFTYPIDKYFAKYDIQNYITAAAEKVAELHEAGLEDLGGKRKLKADTAYRDIIVFVSGLKDVIAIKRLVNGYNSERAFFRDYPVLVVELTGDVVKAQSREYKNLFEDLGKLNVEVYDRAKRSVKIKKPVRRVIISTNVGETGITIHTLKYVVDTGLFKSKEYNPNFSASMLVTKPVTQSMSIQRCGRSGREAPGVFHALYTEATFGAMLRDQYPDIIKDEVTLDLLTLLVRETDPENRANSEPLLDLLGRSNAKWFEGLKSTEINVAQLDLLDLPSADSLHASLEKLYELGAVNSASVPTRLGFIMNKFRFVSAENIRMILAGFAWECSIIDLVNIAAVMEVGFGDIFQRRVENPRILHDLAHLNFLAADDFVCAAAIFNLFEDELANVENYGDLGTDRVATWAQESGLSMEGLYQVVELREEIIGMLAAIGFDPFWQLERGLRHSQRSASSGEDRESLLSAIHRIKLCVHEGYKLNLAVWNLSERKYFSRKTHLPLVMPSTPAGRLIQSASDIAKFGDTNPRVIICHSMKCMPQRTGSLYEVLVPAISVMDGYVPVDMNFDSL
jgi:HrpA-like RNA helicase